MGREDGNIAGGKICMRNKEQEMIEKRKKINFVS